MTVVATVDVPLEAIALGNALDATPEADIRLDRIVPLGDSFVPYLWVRSGCVPTVTTALRETPAIESVEVVDEFEDAALVRVDWRRTVDDVFTLVNEAGGVVLEAGTEDGRWLLHIRFPTRDALGVFYRACDDRDVAITLRDVHGTGPPGATPNCLTDAQMEALTVALERGYFEVPRRVTLSDLAAELGVSDSAVSQRLRRGVGAVLGRVLSERAPPAE